MDYIVNINYQFSSDQDFTLAIPVSGCDNEEEAKNKAIEKLRNVFEIQNEGFKVNYIIAFQLTVSGVAAITTKY